MELDCCYGKLVARIFYDDESYREICIDLVKEDGRKVQLAVIGTNERENLHAYIWDGDNEDVAWSHEINPDGEECY